MINIDDYVLISCEGPYQGAEGVVVALDDSFGNYAWVMLGRDFRPGYPTVYIPVNSLITIYPGAGSC